MKIPRTKQSTTLAIHARPMHPTVLHTSKLAVVRGGDEIPSGDAPSGHGAEINPFYHGG